MDETWIHNLTRDHKNYRETCMKVVALVFGLLLSWKRATGYAGGGTVQTTNPPLFTLSPNLSPQTATSALTDLPRTYFNCQLPRIYTL